MEVSSTTSGGHLDYIWRSLGLNVEVIVNTSGGHVDYMRKPFRLHLEVFQITCVGYLDYTWPGHRGPQKLRGASEHLGASESL